MGPQPLVNVNFIGFSTTTEGHRLQYAILCVYRTCRYTHHSHAVQDLLAGFVRDRLWLDGCPNVLQQPCQPAAAAACQQGRPSLGPPPAMVWQLRQDPGRPPPELAPNPAAEATDGQCDTPQVCVLLV
jgi:hypothetical protein